jgi:heme/copper-type cytochrome/quinol oxidase subunit 1
MLDERLGKIHFWLLFVGFHMTFLVQHWLGVEGLPRRYADNSPSDGFTTLNDSSSIGAFLWGASTLPFLYNMWKSRRGPLVGLDDPWGWGRSLEWATSSPPPTLLTSSKETTPSTAEIRKPRRPVAVIAMASGDDGHLSLLPARELTHALDGHFIGARTQRMVATSTAHPRLRNGQSPRSAWPNATRRREVADARSRRVG